MAKPAVYQGSLYVAIVLHLYWERLIAKTSDLTAAEFGGYVRLLLHQWKKGSVPASNMQRLAHIMGATTSTAKTMWREISPFFHQDEDGQWRNRRLEEVRAEQYAAANRSRSNGAKGGRPPKPRNNPDRNLDETHRLSQTVSQTVSQTEPGRNPEAKPPISDLLKKVPDQTTTNPSDGEPHRASSTSHGLMTNSFEYEKALRFNTFVGARLRVPHKLHGDFRRELGGVDAEARLLAWYAEVDEEIERTQEPIVPDVFKWLEKKYRIWSASLIGDAELEKFRPQGA